MNQLTLTFITMTIVVMMMTMMMNDEYNSITAIAAAALLALY